MEIYIFIWFIGWIIGAGISLELGMNLKRSWLFSFFVWPILIGHALGK